jgi:hypothetical protein
MMVDSSVMALCGAARWWFGVTGKGDLRCGLRNAMRAPKSKSRC